MCDYEGVFYTRGGKMDSFKTPEISDKVWVDEILKGYNNQDGEFRDIAHPIKTETRAELIDVILKAYNEELAKPQE